MKETLSGWSTTVRRGPHGPTATAFMLLAAAICAFYSVGMVLTTVLIVHEGDNINMMISGLTLVFYLLFSVSCGFSAAMAIRRLIRGLTHLQLTITDTQVRMRVLTPWGNRNLPSIALADIFHVSLKGQAFQQTLRFDRQHFPISAPFAERQELMQRLHAAHTAARAFPAEPTPEALLAMVPGAASPASRVISLPSSHDTLIARLGLALCMVIGVVVGAFGMFVMVDALHQGLLFDPRMILYGFGGFTATYLLNHHLRSRGERVVLQPDGGALLVQKRRHDVLLSEQRIPFAQLDDIRLRPSAVRQKLFLNGVEHTVIVPADERQPLVDQLKAWREQRRDLPLPEPATPVEPPIEPPVEDAAPQRRAPRRTVTS